MSRNKDSDAELSKPTFEACLSSQEDLRHLLNRLIEANRPLTNGERDKYFIQLPTSTLGEGCNTVFSMYIENKIYSMKSLEQFGRWLGDQNQIKISFPGAYGNPSSPLVNISLFWREFLNHLYAVFPIALAKALSMSKEDTRGKQGDGYKVN